MENIYYQSDVYLGGDLLLIRKAEVIDAYGIAKVQVDTWRSTYVNIVPDVFLAKMSYEKRKEVWANVIQTTDVFVTENDNGEIVGFASGGKAINGEYENYPGELTAIYILEDYQGQGIGRLLLKEVVNAITKLGFEAMIIFVLKDNPARHFYESLGGKPIDEVEITIGGKVLKEIVYGWDDISKIN